MSWAVRVDEWLTTLGVPHQTVLYPIDHGLSADMAADFTAWLRAPLRLA